MSEAGSQGQPDEATIDLLVKQVTEGLSPTEQRALDVLDNAVASALRRDLERAAAAISLAADLDTAVPPALHARLAQQALNYAASAAGGTPLPMGHVPEPPAAVQAAALRGARTARSARLGWLAAAACLLLALFGWFRTPRPAADVTVALPPPVAPLAVPKPPPSAEEERAALMAKAESLKIPLGATKDPGAAGLTGDVVWDPATQTGFLRFVGLAANDPELHQYQIWIFDGTRDQRYPIDGGVFNVPANSSEIVIPIHAALAVRKPAAFAVTIEKPGGVVVSSREHVVALGTAG